MNNRLTKAGMTIALQHLSSRDSDLANVLQRFGPPPMWTRKPGFPTLLLIILEQQVSLASARAAFQRLEKKVSAVTPLSVLSLNDIEMKAIGFSRQKSTYARHLSNAIVTRRFDPDGLHRMSDVDARATLIELKGIGQWTADVYLMMALRRPDIWPVQDLALAAAAHHVKRLRKRPSPQRLEALGKEWRPWRSVAARVLWHFYLSGGCKKKRNDTPP
jgi:DNA-3-methyladenine glycosylase II